MFINSIGAAWEYGPDKLDDDFFNSDIVVFGGTGLVPQIHDNLTSLLKKAKSKGCITIVNTVFDFRNEKANPSKKWPLGESDESYRYIDLLIADQEEAFRLSGETGSRRLPLDFFIEKKVSSLIITNGSKNISIYSDGRFFNASGIKEMPVSQKVINERKNSQSGDTTGCGDNFVGGVIASVVTQIQNGVKHPDITEACCGELCQAVLPAFIWEEHILKRKQEKNRPKWNHIMRLTKDKSQVESRKISHFRCR